MCSLLQNVMREHTFDITKWQKALDLFFTVTKRNQFIYFLMTTKIRNLFYGCAQII